MKISDIQKEVFKTAKSKGWYDNCPPADDVNWCSARIALIHSEASEALECVRDGDLSLRFEKDKFGNLKPEGLPSELADIVIRVMDFCESLGIDLENAIKTKSEFNKTRNYRHGGRKI